MNTSQFFTLLLVSAIWGASHPLMRIAVPEWGSVLTAFLRIGIAALALIIFALASRLPLELKKNAKVFLIVGFFNAAFPVFLLAHAAHTLPASYLIILNASVPIFSAVFASIFLREPFTLKKVSGIILGVAGLILVEELGTLQNMDLAAWIAITCVLVASASYGMTAVYLKGTGVKIPPLSLTAGSSLFGALFLLPFATQARWHFEWNVSIPAILVLGILGSGFAFVLFYRLLEQIGPFRASLTTFVMPVFGLFWGWLFLGEHVNVYMLIGVAMVISATSLFVKTESTKK